jgi:asparagine synthase (glutamine-hydrolysing)
MCRIVGYWQTKRDSPEYNTDIVVSMRDSMIHGGPDDAGIFMDDKINLVMGHRRLSIIDLSTAGRQPFTFDFLTICYNGEVYNYSEIRQELREKGYSFVSDSDTEVILKSFHCWGKRCVEKFRGMFAFAIWNAETQELFLCRDRVGVKPLYYYWDGDLFIFASEVKAFHSHPKFVASICPYSLRSYFEFGYISSPRSIYKNLSKLIPGSWLTITANGLGEVEKYWSLDLQYNSSVNKIDKDDEQQYIDQLHNLIVESFQYRMVADVPVGVFLSGGVDSSLVAAVLQSNTSSPLKTFTIGFEDKEFDESPYAEAVASWLGTDHTTEICKNDDVERVILKLPEVYDEPFGDSSAIPTILVAEIASKHVKVSLSADGGDEQFLGYPVYHDFSLRAKKWLRYKKWFPFSILPDFLIRFLLSRFRYSEYEIEKLLLRIKAKDVQQLYLSYQYHFTPNETKKMVPTIHGMDERSEGIFSLLLRDGIEIPKLLSYLDVHSYLPDDILVKVDKATMSQSLEGREPLLDHHIMEFSASMPVAFHFSDSRAKWPLRNILYKYVPQELIDRPKKGFAIPLLKRFKPIIDKLLLEFDNPEFLSSIDVVDSDYFSNILNDYKDGKFVEETRIWYILVFFMWYRKYHFNKAQT